MGEVGKRRQLGAQSRFGFGHAPIGQRPGLQNSFGRAAAQWPVAQAQPGQANIVQAARLPARRGCQTSQRVVALAARKLAEMVPHAGSNNRYLAGYEQFLRLQGSGVQALKKIDRSDPAFGRSAGQHQGSVKRQGAGRPFGCGVGIGQGAAKSAQVANGAVRDVRGRLTQQGCVPCHQDGFFHFHVPRERADAQHATLQGDAAPRLQPGNVYEQRRVREPHIERRQQGLPTR